ncbi:hypothetical protein ABG79_02424 [Caloramator mitchellensis]|uniref:Putative Se/S carrier protein-like domain-containing protein n=1 Tax=Caloramator mitchellensis TaxID=908809 RepID=A0A0R3JQV0_CALMK|nr:DUF3343 domain-containing protein [Caloramator mitchellensis]KRQ85801.1 hypothetical protein ABG79_02424 [Caloramator mitchellensis]
MEYVVTFHTQNGAFKFQRFLLGKQIEVKLMPTPRKLSSSCGIAASFEYEGEIQGFIIEEVDGVYLKEGIEYKVIYKD